MRFVWLAVATFAFLFGVIYVDRLAATVLALKTPITAYAATSGGAGHYMTLESPVGTDYSVPAGKSFIITKVVYTGGSIGDMIVLGYGNSGVGNGAPAPTSPVSLVGAAGATPTSPLVVEAVNIAHVIEVSFSIPAGKYPFIQASGTVSSVQVIGIEQ